MRLVDVNLVCIVFLMISYQLIGQSFSYKEVEMVKRYVEDMKPIYIIGEVKLAVPRLPQPPDSINKILYYCIDNDIHSVDKYAFYAIMKLKIEYLKKTKSDYDLCYSKNGLLDVVLNRMKIKFDTTDDMDCYFFRTYDVYLWLIKNKKVYEDHKELDKQMKVIKLLIGK